MTVQIDYALGLTGLTVTATAYAEASGDAAGVVLTFTENATRKGRYSVTATVGGGGNLVAGLNWIQLNVAGSPFDSQFVKIVDGGTVVLLPSQFEANTAVQTGDSFARIGNNGASLTGLGDARLANLDATVSSRLATSGYTAPDNTDAAAAASQTTAAAIRSAIGLTAANLDSQLAEIEAVTDGIASINSVPVSVTIPAAVAVASQTPSLIAIQTFSTLRRTLPPMGSISGRQSLILAIKANPTDPDSAALVLISEAGGLLTVAGANASNSSLGSLTVTDQAAGSVDFFLDKAASALLTATDGRDGQFYWGCKWKAANGDETEAIGGRVVVTNGIVRAV